MYKMKEGVLKLQRYIVLNPTVNKFIEYPYKLFKVHKKCSH